MTDKTISQLSAASTLTGPELVPIVQGGTTVRTTVQNIGNYTPAGKSYTLLENAIPFVIVSSGTMGNNGALSGITAVATAYTSAYVYLPANAIVAGSAAGWYYAVFSTTTAATVYNNVYTSGVPTVPSSPTAFATTGPGAYTQTTGLLPSLTVTLPANSIGKNGTIDFEVETTQTNNANNKFVYVMADAVTYLLTLNAFSLSYANTISHLRARGVTNRLSSTVIHSGGSAFGSGAVVRVLDMTAQHTIDLRPSLANAADTLTIEGVKISVMP